MDPIKTLDEIKLIASILRSVSEMHPDWVKPREYKAFVREIERRVSAEGLSFLTTALPRLGKALDRALSGTVPMVFTGFSPERDPDGTVHNFPCFMGGLFRRVLDQSGMVLPSPCIASVRYIRQITYLFYKYDLPYSDEQNLAVVARFVETEHEVQSYNERFQNYRSRAFTRLMLLHESSSAAQAYQRSAWCERQEVCCRGVVEAGSSSGAPLFGEALSATYRCPEGVIYPVPVTGTWNSALPTSTAQVLIKAQRLLSEALKGLDLRNIRPCHGPGSVSTKETLEQKYRFTWIPKRLHDEYPWDSYFVASLGHLSDSLADGNIPIRTEEPLARVVLVPKDSRGPRLISCEPLAFQWAQQGIRRALYAHVENHHLTRWNVFFTNQQPNQFGALLGSKTGSYATLDLKDASDRVGLELVRVLFPGHVLRALEATRSVGTILPDGKQIILQKFAPMGSALCFPIMALTIWSLLTAAAEDTDTREGILVYGDDVIVPAAFADTAIKTLEEFGLKANLDKCCIKGRFRESCGVDAFAGENVTPLRIREAMPSLHSTSKEVEHRPELYLKWLAYARHLWDRDLYRAYEYVIGRLQAVYGHVLTDDQVSIPALSVPWLGSPNPRPPKVRWNKRLQRREVQTWMVVSQRVKRWLPGWCRLLRYFTEQGSSSEEPHDEHPIRATSPSRWNQATAEAVALSEYGLSKPGPSWDSDMYTARGDVSLSLRWRVIDG